MTKKLDDRIEEAFQKGDKDQAIQYLEWLRPTMLDYASSIRRTSIAMVLLVAIFELVVSSKNIKITVGSFQIARDSIVLVFLPSLIAYLYMQTIWDTVRNDYLSEAFKTIFKIWSDNAEKNDLDDLFTPPQLMYFSVIGGRLREENSRQIDKLDYRASFVFYVIFFLGAFAFEGQAYFVLFPYHPGEVLGWVISLCITILCLFISILTLYHFAADEN